MGTEPQSIYIGNLPFDTQKAELDELFSHFGPVGSIVMINNKDTGTFKGFAFVEMERRHAVEAVDKLNGREFGGREVRISLSDHSQRPPKPEKNPRREETQQNEPPSYRNSGRPHARRPLSPTPPSRPMERERGRGYDWQPPPPAPRSPPRLPRSPPRADRHDLYKFRYSPGRSRDSFPPSHAEPRYYSPPRDLDYRGAPPPPRGYYPPPPYPSEYPSRYGREYPHDDYYNPPPPPPHRERDRARPNDYPPYPRDNYPPYPLEEPYPPYDPRRERLPPRQDPHPRSRPGPPSPSRQRDSRSYESRHSYNVDRGNMDRGRGGPIRQPPRRPRGEGPY